jgi:large subunit ribosomal protein L29
MKAKDLRNKSVVELRKMADELRKKISQLLIDKSLNKLSKPHLLRLIKKDLARVLTIIKENEKTSNR